MAEEKRGASLEEPEERLLPIRKDLFSKELKFLNLRILSPG